MCVLVVVLMYYGLFAPCVSLLLLCVISDGLTSSPSIRSSYRNLLSTFNFPFARPQKNQSRREREAAFPISDANAPSEIPPQSDILCKHPSASARHRATSSGILALYTTVGSTYPPCKWSVSRLCSQPQFPTAPPKLSNIKERDQKIVKCNTGHTENYVRLQLIHLLTFLITSPS